MAYTNNVPQATQRISDTQAPILANFTFLPLSIGQEHNFNSSDPTQTYHLQASMPNLSGGDPVSLPSGTNGLYYVLGGVPKFFNSGGASFIQTASVLLHTLKGTQALTTSFANVLAIANGLCGTYYLFNPSVSSTSACAAGQFITANNQLYISGLNVTGQDPGLTLNASGLVFQAKTDSGSFNGTYTWVFSYFQP